MHFDRIRCPIGIVEERSPSFCGRYGHGPRAWLLRVDTPNRDSLACGLMEVCRPRGVDAFVLNWLQRKPLRKSDFWEDRNDNCRIGSSWQSSFARLRARGRLAPQRRPSARLAQTQRRRGLARWAWKPSSLPAWLNEEVYTRKIQPLLKDIAIPVIMSALGIFGHIRRRHICRRHPRGAAPTSSAPLACAGGTGGGVGGRSMSTTAICVTYRVPVQDSTLFFPRALCRRLAGIGVTQHSLLQLRIHFVCDGNHVRQ
jgi:hypothetical protein